MTRADLLRAGPYRLFFPLGILNGLLGVGHWVFWSIGWIKESDSFFHTALQIQGFLACFVVGFLMTALPRFLGSRNASNAELLASFTPAFLFTLFALQKEWAVAQACFLLMLGSVLPFGARRFPQRSKNLPGSFLLIVFGLAHALAGTILFFADGSFALLEVGRQMRQIGFPLCLALGIAGYLAPFLMGYASDPSCDPEAAAVRGTSPSAMAFHALTGGLLFLSFAIEPGFPRAAAFTRALLASLHLLWFARIGRRVKKKAVHVYFFWISCWMIPIGLWFAALARDYRIAGLHLVFIGGFSLLIFSFAMLVVLSHGARAHLLNTRLIPLQVVCHSVLTAAFLRLAADIDAWRYRFWIHMASGFWVAAALVWLIYVLPKLWSLPPFLQNEERIPS